MYKNKKIFILGMGRSGVSVAKLLCKNNRILITDLKNSEEEDYLRSLGVEVVITDKQEDFLDESFDLVVKNPGVKLDNPVVIKAEKMNIPIITELEVAYRYLPNVKIIGITGSNGKTTTTTIVYEILKMASLPVHLAGNIGIPLCDKIDEIKDGDILVVEVSSHQLVNLDKFKANISVLTNLSKVHLDHFGTYQNYKKNKLKIFNNQTSNDIAILNKGDKEVYKLTENINAKKLYFSSKDEADIYIKDGYIVYKGEKCFDISDIRVKGIHNLENIMASILIAKQFNVSDEDINKVLNNFAGVEHRLEFVSKIDDIEFYNDSKSTNNMSTITALKSFDKNIVLILGGLDRGQSFDELLPYLNNTKHIVCYGQTKNNIEKFALKNNIDVTIVDNVEEAVKASHNIASSGEIVLFSPACASWDQYKNFEERGNDFKNSVKNL